MDNLKELYMEDNLITNITTETFSSVKKLTWLSLPNNPVICDCHLQGLHILKPDLGIDGECNSPTNGKYTDIMEFVRSGVTCDEKLICGYNHCANNGTCVVLNKTEFTCNCRKEFTGKTCGKAKADKDNNGITLRSDVLGVVIQIIIGLKLWNW